MLNGHHSLSFRIATLVLAQNAVVAALLVYAVGEMTLQNMLLIAVFLIALTAATVLLVGHVLAPLKAVATSISERTAGEPAVSPRYLLLTDEIGIISRELERLSRYHLDRILKQDEQRSERQRMANEEGARNLLTAQAEAEALKVVVDALDAGLRRLAVGDLTVRLGRPLPEEFEALRSDFNHALEAIENAFDRIGSGSRSVSSYCAGMQDDLTEAVLVHTGQSAVATALASDIDALSETIKTTKMQSGLAADIAHNADLDMRRSKQLVEATAKAMETIREASAKIDPATRTIHKIAFDANMLAVNAGIEAAQASETEPGLKAIAEEIRDLAGRAAEAAKEISSLSRASAEAADRGGKSVEQVCREWDAMTIYADALKAQTDAIAESSAKELDLVTGIRSVGMAVAKASRDYTARLDLLTQKAGTIGREVAAIDHHAARFAPVTILTPGCVTVPEGVKRPKPGAHLRLVKS